MSERRWLLSRLAALPVVVWGATAAAAKTARPLRILVKSAWGSDDPTKAGFAFFHARALAEAGHDVHVFLLGEAVSVLRRSVAQATVPVGWPPVAEALAELARRKTPIYACGACSRARGVVDADLAPWGARFGSPEIFVGLVETADRILTE